MRGGLDDRPADLNPFFEPVSRDGFQHGFGRCWRSARWKTLISFPAFPTCPYRLAMLPRFLRIFHLCRRPTVPGILYSLFFQRLCIMVRHKCHGTSIHDTEATARENRGKKDGSHYNLPFSILSHNGPAPGTLAHARYAGKRKTPDTVTVSIGAE